MLLSAKVNRRNMAEAASDPGLMATDLAEWLVGQGVPFRDAHHQVGRFVGACRAAGVPLHAAPIELMRESIPLATEECRLLFDPRRSLAARRTLGGTAPERVDEQLRFWEEQLQA
jgi:argininosuccinate lyase